MLMFKECDVYKCKSHFGYCEEQGRCTSPTCPNYQKGEEVLKERNLDEERLECVRILSRSSEASQEYTKGKLRVAAKEGK
jgi:hypothetical protein